MKNLTEKLPKVGLEYRFWICLVTLDSMSLVLLASISTSTVWLYRTFGLLGVHLAHHGAIRWTVQRL